VDLSGSNRLYRKHDADGTAGARVVLIASSFVLISLVSVLA
jgi:hypothetical protein